MKIPAIIGYNRFNKKQEYSHNISFQKRTALSKALGDKLGHILPEINYGDVVTIGQDIKTVSSGLKKALTQYSGLIKRILHINASISIPMAFSLDETGEIQCTNIGEKPFALVKNLHTTDNDYRHASLNSNESQDIQEGDIIVNGKHEIEISDFLNEFAMSNDNILEYPPVEKFVSNIYDFSEIQHLQIQKNNETLLEKLTQNSNNTPKNDKISFKNIGGLDDIITKLKKGIVYPIEFPYAYENRKKLNKGFILYGPPGTGKTLLAQALANEVKAYYIKLNGLEMASKWVGESEENWRKLFNTAKNNQPSIIFIDEFDAIGRSRKGTDNHGDNVVNQVLTLIDDIEKENQQVFIITATNKFENLDDAIIRSGRLGEKIKVSAPDRKGLDQIYNIHINNKNVDTLFDKSKFLDECAKDKMTGADIAYIIDKAHEFSWERCNIYEKMENKTLEKEDLLNTYITNEDFTKALEQWKKQQNRKNRNPIGY